MRPWFVAIALATAGAGEAKARIVDDRTFCTTLRGLLTAAAERPAFASLGRAGRARAATGLGFESCAIESGPNGNRLVCSRMSIPRYPTGPTTEMRIAECVPEALPMTEPAGSPLARFRLGTLSLHVDRSASPTRLVLFALPVERR